MVNDVEFNDRRVSYTATSGQTIFDIDFPIDVIGDVAVYQQGALVSSDDYTVDVDGLTVTLDTGATLDDSIVIDGDTDPVRESSFPRGGDLRTLVLNGDFRRIFYILQELQRDSDVGISLNPAEGSSVSGALPLKSENKALVWGANGLVNGPTVDEIDNAVDYALAASNSATAASASAVSAAAAVVTLQGLIDNFDDLYLGQKASDPTVDNDGDALQDGALYFNTTDNIMKVYDLGGTAWLSLNPEVFSIDALTELAEAPNQSDLLPISDISASAQKKITVRNIFAAVDNLGTLSAPDLDDKIAGVNVSNGLAVGIEVQELLKSVDKLTEDSSPDLAADFLLGFDTSEGVAKKIKPENITGASLAQVMPNIRGLKLSPGTDAEHDIDVTAGTAADSTASVLMTLASGLTKKLDASWASGTAAGGLSSSLTLSNNTWYHAFEIVVAGSVDVGFDTDEDAANLIADHSATSYRYIGSVMTDGSANIRQFTQNGNWFSWVTPYMDSSAGSSTTAASITLTVPTGMKALAECLISITSNGVYSLLSSLDRTDVAVSNSSSPLKNAGSAAGGNNGGYAQEWTNTSSQVRLRSTGGGATVYVETLGYYLDLSL